MLSVFVKTNGVITSTLLKRDDAGLLGLRAERMYKMAQVRKPSCKLGDMVKYNVRHGTSRIKPIGNTYRPLRCLS
jgi:hypothetical protein